MGPICAIVEQMALNNRATQKTVSKVSKGGLSSRDCWCSCHCGAQHALWQSRWALMKLSSQDLCKCASSAISVGPSGLHFNKVEMSF